MKSFVLGSGAVVGLIFWVIFAPTPKSLIGFSPMGAAGDHILFLALGYLLMLVGIVLGVIVRSLLKMRDAGQQEVDILKHLSRSRKSVDLWLSLFASPVLYGGLLVGHEVGRLQFLYFALQTGFSSYVIIKTLLETKA